MIKRLGIISVAVLAALVMGGGARATTISYTYAPDADMVLTTAMPGALVETFNTGWFDQTAWTWSTGGAGAELVDGVSTAGQFAQPYNGVDGIADPTWYLAVPDSQRGSTGWANIDFGRTYTYFGLFWGTIDAYNYVNFYNGSSLVASYGGGALPAPAQPNGGWTNPNANLYVDFNDLPEFDSVTLLSTGVAFEVDNIAVASAAPVPEPATVALMGIGAALLIGLRKRRKTA